MQKSFYSSGFLYHSASKQILLQQFTNGASVNFSLFRNKSVKGNDPKKVFKNHLKDILGVDISDDSIHAVYDYVHDKFGEHFIFYAEIEDSTLSKYVTKINSEWILLSKLSKFNINDQTRHDIIVGERVIRSRMESARSPEQSRVNQQM